jgi:hypothetical protein
VSTANFSNSQSLGDSRGNRLIRWATTNIAAGHALWLRGPHEAGDHVVAVAPEYVRLPVPSEARLAWTHVLEAPGPLRSDVAQMLGVLQNVILLPSPANVDIAIALDWYKIADDAVDPWKWPNTETAELLRQGKYLNPYNPMEQRRAGLALVDRLCRIIEGHAGIRQSTVVLDVPGHDRQRVSFGSRVAVSVARRLSLPVTTTSARTEFRPPAKNADSAERIAAIKDQFFVPFDLQGHVALVVDDVFKSGTSMSETARAARTAGAMTVNGIVAVRTMKAR